MRADTFYKVFIRRLNEMYFIAADNQHLVKSLQKGQAVRD